MMAESQGRNAFSIGTHLGKQLIPHASYWEKDLAIPATDARGSASSENPARHDLVAIPLQRLQTLQEKVTSGSFILDKFLNGGFNTGQITELVGESGTGKTQLCLQIALSAQLLENRSPGCCLYIHTDSRFPLRRLQQISELLRFRRDIPFPVVTGVNATNSWTNLCENVYIREMHSAEELVECISNGVLRRELEMPRNLPVRVIIIDSFASLIRSEFDYSKTDLIARSALLFSLSSSLKQLAEEFQVAILVTNQVTEVFDVKGSYSHENQQLLQSMPAMCSFGRPLLPALGLAWSHCVNTRIFLARKDDVAASSHFPSEGCSVARRMSVVFSPHLPQQHVAFCIRHDGVSGVEEERREKTTLAFLPGAARDLPLVAVSENQLALTVPVEHSVPGGSHDGHA